MSLDDTLIFHNIKWVICEKKKSLCGVVYYKYKVYRKYGRKWLRNTNCTYTIFPHRFNRLKKELKKDSNFYYTQAIGYL